jgi:hypothetical protein
VRGHEAFAPDVVRPAGARWWRLPHHPRWRRAGRAIQILQVR